MVAAEEEIDWRIAALEHELVSEVRRFDLLARDVAEDNDAAATDDALCELRAYRTSTAKALRCDMSERLYSAKTALRCLLDRASAHDVGHWCHSSDLAYRSHCSPRCLSMNSAWYKVHTSHASSRPSEACCRTTSQGWCGQRNCTRIRWC